MIRTLTSTALRLMLIYHLGVVATGANYEAQVHYPHYLPWVPLAISHPLGPATRGKQVALQGDLPACLAVLHREGLLAEPVSLRSDEPACAIPDSVNLQRMRYPYTPSNVPMSCPLAVSLALWERHVVGVAAAETLQTEVTRIRHYGTWNCRAVRNSRSGNWSRHANATAIDIAAFDLADGSTVSVAQDYGDDSPQGAFMRELKRGGCSVFGTVLSPDYNAAHADHFHMQQSGGLCR